MSDPPAPSSVERMLDIFDVTPVGEHRYEGTSDGGGRRVVDGSQYFAQAIVAASKSVPDKTVRSAHAVFSRPVNDVQPLWFDVDLIHRGRSFASAMVAVGQGERRCATVTVLLDVAHDDVIRHASVLADVAGPDRALPGDMPMIGRELRLVDVADVNSPDEVGPPNLYAWVRYNPVPSRPELAKALLAHFTGHLSISTTMRAHRGIGTAQSHDRVSTAPITIGVAFHEPVAWDGWLLYAHDSTYAGAGMSYVRGQVFTETGHLLASFSQEAMIRALTPTEQDKPVEGRL